VLFDRGVLLLISLVREIRLHLNSAQRSTEYEWEIRLDYIRPRRLRQLHVDCDKLPLLHICSGDVTPASTDLSRTQPDAARDP
jgi:hypothetical protein